MKISPFMIAAGLAVGYPVASSQPLGMVPVGMILDGRGATLRPSGSGLPLLAKAGDLLYAGDSVAALEDSPIILSCADSSRKTLAPGAEATVQTAGIRGKWTKSEPVAYCVLPPAPSASDGHRGSPEEAPPLESPADLPEGLRRELLLADGEDFAARVARAELYARYDRPALAAAEYRKLRADVPAAEGLALSRIFILEEKAVRKAVRKPVDPTIGGRTYALLVGISNFKDALIRNLRYAHQDALLFERFLRSPRGGSLGEDDITVLINEAATTSAVKAAFQTMLRKATAKDTVIVLLATHGTVIETAAGKSRGAYIVTHDSDPEDLASTALPMSAVQNFLREDLSKAARVLAFVDACRAGTIGTIPDKIKLKINAQLDSLTQSEAQLFLFTASRPGEVSYEGRQYGGGHGAFSFFVLEGLNGAADFDQDGAVTIGEMSVYVSQRVAEATIDKQHPREGGTLDTTIRVADTGKTGIDVGTYSKGVVDAEPAQAQRRSIDGKARQAAVRTLHIPQAVDFDDAIEKGRILPDQPGNAFSAFGRLKLARRLTRDQVLSQENRLRAAVEDRAQETLTHYLKSGQETPRREEFAQGARLLSAAIQMNGETPRLMSRLAFCEGRLALFDKDPARARTLLESAIRLDPDAAFHYNALGTAYLQQGEFAPAREAFLTAMDRAPHWVYPMHNLALAHMQAGDSEEAIATLQRAAKLAPHYAYLPYNLGLVWQQLNRRKEAEAAYRRALELAPDLAEASNALGYLRLEQNRLGEAETLFRRALAQKPSLLEARQNLGAACARSPERRAEAINHWRENLAADPAFLRSRLSLAGALQADGKTAEAISEYLTLLQLEPGFVAVRVAVAALQEEMGERDAAVASLRAAALAQPDSPEVWERIGNLEEKRGNATAAREAFQHALENGMTGQARRRLQTKLKTTGASAMR